MKQQPNNVIPFPGPKKKGPKEDTNRKPTLFFDFENRKVMVSASLGSVLLLAALVNVSINSITKNEQVALKEMNSVHRGIASVDPRWEENLVRELASVEAKASEVQSVGRRPNAIEDLRFGQLAGNYAMEFHKGKVKNIRYVSGQNSLPKYLNDREQFLWKNREVLPFQFDSVTQMPVVENSEGRIESYRLTKGESSPTQVDFHLDKFGRFISMKVQNIR